MKDFKNACFLELFNPFSIQVISFILRHPINDGIDLDNDLTYQKCGLIIAMQIIEK